MDNDRCLDYLRDHGELCTEMLDICRKAGLSLRNLCHAGLWWPPRLSYDMEDLSYDREDDGLP